MKPLTVYKTDTVQSAAGFVTLYFSGCCAVCLEPNLIVFGCGGGVLSEAQVLQMKCTQSADHRRCERLCKEQLTQRQGAQTPAEFLDNQTSQSL